MSDPLERIFQSACDRLEKLRRRTLSELQPEDGLLSEALAEVSNAMDELHILAEELQRQNEELLKARTEIEIQRQRYEELFHLAPDGYLVTDVNGTIEEANTAATQLLNIRYYGYLIGKPLIVFIENSDRQKFRQLCHELTQTGQTQRGEVQIYHAEGKTNFPADLTIGAIYNRAGQVIGIRCLLRDISILKQTEEVLRQTNYDLERRIEERTAQWQEAAQAAQSANFAKTTFLARMSHEFRTPLHVILGCTQLLYFNSGLDSTQKQQLNTINRKGKHLLDLINNVLAMSNIDLGKTSLTCDDFNLYRLLDLLTSSFQMRADLQETQLTVKCDLDIPQYIKTDRKKLIYVLSNLIDNALKYTERGRVTLRIQRGNLYLYHNITPSTSFSHHLLNSLHFEVEDTGIGIASDDLKQLFEPFFQSQSLLKQEGTGLGLSITQQYIHLMGGELSATSQLGVGSIFQFDIPITLSSSNNLPETESLHQIIDLKPSIKIHRLLWVDENTPTLLTNRLDLLGFEIKQTANPLEAIEIWQSWQPNLMLINLSLQNLDGYRIMQEIRSIEQKQQKTPIYIIALATEALIQERSKIFSVGCNDLIDLPYEEIAFLEKIAQFLGICVFSEELGFLTPNLESEQEDIPPSFVNFTALEVMPLDWLQKLSQAKETLDSTVILALLEQIPQKHTDLIKFLQVKLYNFDFELIWDLVQKAISIKEQEKC